MSGRKASFACEVTVVLLVAAGEDAGMQIKKIKLKIFKCNGWPNIMRIIYAYKDPKTLKVGYDSSMQQDERDLLFLRFIVAKIHFELC